MSRASAYVQRFDGALVAHGVYCGTSDVLGPSLHDTSEAAWDYWYGRAPRPDGRNAWDVLSECDHVRHQGYVFSDYGGGFYWPVEYCAECMVIHGPLDWDWILDAYGYDWPKDGKPPIEA